MTKFDAQIKQLQKALVSFEIALRAEKNDFVRDSAIQRFEFCFDLLWKTAKTWLLEKHGIVVNSPKICFKELFALGVLENEDNFLVYLNLRNETVHTYNEEKAEEVFGILPKVYDDFILLLNKLYI